MDRLGIFDIVMGANIAAINKMGHDTKKLKTIVEKQRAVVEAEEISREN